MSELLHKLTTNWGKLQVFEDRVSIEKIDELRIIDGDVKSEKIINIKDIKTIQFRSPSFMRSGYIQFAVGGSEHETAENTFMFGEDKMLVARKIKDTVNRLMSKRPDNAITSKSSDADEIFKFKKLLDDGVITQGEFEAKKKQILRL